jgi:hypothetical protein
MLLTAILLITNVVRGCGCAWIIDLGKAPAAEQITMGLRAVNAYCSCGRSSVDWGTCGFLDTAWAWQATSAHLQVNQQTRQRQEPGDQAARDVIPLFPQFRPWIPGRKTEAFTTPLCLVCVRAEIFGFRQPAHCRRTPRTGQFFGPLQTRPAKAIRAEPDQIFPTGHLGRKVLTFGFGTNPPRQALLHLGLPESRYPNFLYNKSERQSKYASEHTGQTYL